MSRLRPRRLFDGTTAPSTFTPPIFTNASAPPFLEDTGGSCVYCNDARCSACRSPEPCMWCQVRVFPEVSEGDNKLANSPFRSMLIGESLECCVCYEVIAASGRVFVPPCHKAHAVCSKCLFKCLCKTGDIRDFYSCVMCRAQICIRAALPTLWFACILASGADGLNQIETTSASAFTLFPAISRANMFRDVRSGLLRVRAASRLLGSPPTDDHERSQCAIPNCFQCAAGSWPESPIEKSGEATTHDSPDVFIQRTGDMSGSATVAALIHLTPGIEQRSLVLYAEKLAHLTPDRLLSLSASDVADFPLEHQRRLLEHMAHVSRLSPTSRTFL